MLATALLWNVSAVAQPIAVYGLGGKQCGQYLSDMEKQKSRYESVAAAQYANWAEGYLTGYNALTSGKQVEANLPRATIIAYIDKYCREKPLRPVFQAVDCLLSSVGGPDHPYCK